MGDRSNPIKFGPEWLRNFSTERRPPTTSSVTSSTTFATVAGIAITSPTSSASSTTTNTATLGAAGGGGTSNVSAHTATNIGIPGASGGGTASNANTQQPSNSSQHNPKILLAKLRYGREEMLALYDKETAEPPPDLKYNELLYKSREQPPMALNSTFDDEIRESMRNNQPPPPATDRGVGRPRSGTAPNEGRGRGRLYHRQLSTGRGQWNSVNPRMLGYSPGPEDQSMSRLWGPVNVRPRSPTRNGTEAEWGSQRVFRSKRMNVPNNWRAQTRDENEEWRLDSRPRSIQDKRDRSWNDRTSDKSWNSNRRPWVGSAGQNEESLPEWAVGSAEANPGTFDSSGAFHGYSNDDSSLSRTQESSYTLTRSHTHGSFARSKTTEEGPEKDNNKLSTRKFDATEVKFKRVSFKQPLEADNGNDASATDILNVPSTSKEENASYDSEAVSECDETPPNPPKSPEKNDSSENYSTTVYNSAYGDTNSFDALMMSNINLDEGTDDRSNFQSVMIAPSNSLRQKHQNIVSSENSSGTTTLTRGYLQMRHHTSNQQSAEEGTSHHPHEVQLVERICDMTLDDNKLTSTASSIMRNTSTSIASGMSTINSMEQIPSPNIQMLIANSTLTNPPLLMNAQSVPAPGMHQLPIVPRMNSNLNPNMGLQMDSGNNPIGMRLPLHGLPVPNHSMSNTGIALPPSGIIGFPPSSGIPNTSADSKNSLFLGPNPNNSSISPSDIPLPGHGGPSNAFPIHGMQQRSNMQPSTFRGSLFPNMMHPPPPPPPPSASNTSNLADQWYYEDPKKTVQGPFTPKEMYTWYRAGFFGPSLMVRRGIDTHMRPLGSFSPIVPFAQDMLPPFPFGSLDSHNIQGPMDTMLNTQQNLAIDVNSLMGNLQSNPNPGLDSMQFPVGRMNNTPFTPQPMEYPWGQPTSSELMWMQPMNDARNESRVNNLPPFFWDHQHSIKEMKTEDQILAQIKATQNISIPTTQSSTFFKEPLPITSVASSTDDGAFEKATLNLEELQKLIPTNVLTPHLQITEASMIKSESLLQQVKKSEQDVEPPSVETSGMKSLPVQNKLTTETKQIKQAKNESEKNVKNKDTNGTKSKNKNKSKDDKKEDADVKNKEDEVVKTEKRSLESSPTKSKKDEKLNKKEMEKEKKDWIKEGFTIVKGSEKTSKESRKKSEEAKVAEDAEKRRKEEEKLAAEEEKKKKQADSLKRQQEQLLREQHQRQLESVPKKAPWSIASHTFQATDNEGLTLAEIQRLEREKKLEQMKEQQQAINIIAQQQAAALAREQEMQAGLGWAKKKLNSSGLQNQTLAEIQAETRKTAAANAAAAAAIQVFEEPLTTLSAVNHMPWGNSPNGGGFWDAQPNQTMKLPEKQTEFPKPIEQPKKKKVSAVPTLKKETSPVSDFESWCTGALSSWSYKIDVPTFFGFLKDIESPYEVKDYVKCYLGETKDSSDFARHFLEKRSKLLRVGMVTPSDDLCSPAVAVNPRTASSSDNQETKGKGKKTKKNKMLKIDARILGFSVTAAEDRINVGDIDTV